MVPRPWETVQAAQKPETKITRLGSLPEWVALDNGSSQGQIVAERGSSQAPYPLEPSDARLTPGASRNGFFIRESLNFLTRSLTLQLVPQTLALSVHMCTAGQEAGKPAYWCKGMEEEQFLIGPGPSCIFFLQHPPHLLEMRWLVNISIILSKTYYQVLLFAFAFWYSVIVSTKAS